jgi:hypothetical protein
MWKRRINPELGESDRDTLGMVIGICPHCGECVLKSEQHHYELPQVAHDKCQVRFAGVSVQ